MFYRGGLTTRLADKFIKPLTFATSKFPLYSIRIAIQEIPGRQTELRCWFQFYTRDPSAPEILNETPASTIIEGE